MTRERVVVAMSGGVDSCVAAALLAQQGHEVIGITMQLWPKEMCGAQVQAKSCCSLRDTDDARAVAARLSIPFYVLNLQEAFATHVIDYFVDTYAQGMTPNPCVACNDHIKFGALMTQAQQLDADFVATGHYARVAFDETRRRHVLRQGRDLSKDQSYVLFGLTQEQLSRTLFPLGDYDKTQVRAIARELGMSTADKPDSQEICFIRDNDKDGFLRRRLPQSAVPGPIVNAQGAVLGTHEGLLGFTIGQREGIGVAAPHRLYVIGMDHEQNRLIVGTRQELEQRSLIARDLNWIAIEQPVVGMAVQAMVRSRAPKAPAVITEVRDDAITLIFDEPQLAIAPGQAVVLYEDDVVLGGGWIAPMPALVEAVS